MHNTFEKINRYCLEEICTRDVFDEATITVPVTIRAESRVGEVDINCCGPAEIIEGIEASGEPGAEKKFTVKQRMRVDIPLEFLAEADVGQGHVCFEPAEDPGFHHHEHDSGCGCGCKKECNCG